MVGPALEQARREHNFAWLPFPGRQTTFMQAGEFDVFFGGAKGPGKSDCILMGATRQTHLARYKALILRETFGELQDLIDRSHRIFPQLSSRPAWSGELKRWVFPGGGVVQFKYCRTADDVDVVAQGQEWAYIGYDEIGKLPEEKVVDKLIAEIRCANPAVVWMFRSGGNPGGPGHPWLKRRYVNPCGKRGERILVREITLPNGKTARITRRYIPARVTDNPVYANDPLYMAQLWTLPEVLRNQLLYGDWDAGYGMALEELEERIHFKKPFPVPAHWTQFGSFDWGYAHWWVFIWWAVDEDGRLYVVDHVRGRRMLVPQIAERIRERVPLEALSYIHAGHDIIARNDSRRAEGQDYSPTLQEEFAEHGVVMVPGNAARKQGLMNARHAIAWRGQGENGRDADPWLYFMDHKYNRTLFEQLQGMIVDEDDMEDVLKVDADPITGEGGDDSYDAFKVGINSRPPRAIGTFYSGNVKAFSAQTLHFEVEHKYRDKVMPSNQRDFYEPTSGGSNYTSHGGGW